jgi:hypothetical protein
MKHDQQDRILHTLRASLDHFDSSPDFGDAADVRVIKSFLALRIREAESAMRHHADDQVHEGAA